MWQIWSQSLSFFALNFSCKYCLHYHPQGHGTISLISSISISKKVIQNVQSWQAKKFQHLGNVGFEHPKLVLSTLFYSKEKHQPPNQKVEFQDILKFLVKP
jgi:hypothetical protein